MDEEGVVGAVENLVDEWAQRNKVKIKFHSNVAELDLPPLLENTVFRIVQECITNACRHSKSKKVKVELIQRGEWLKIRVQDWGVGFKIGRVAKGHFGLEGIQERARIFAGHASIKSGPRRDGDSRGVASASGVRCVAVSCRRASPHQDHHQPLRAVDAEDQDLFDVGSAAGAGDEHDLAAGIGAAQTLEIGPQAAGRCSTSCSTRAITMQAGGR